MGTYLLTLAGAEEDAAQTGDLDLNGGLTINGAGQNNTLIDGNGTDRVFDVQSDAAVQISGVTIQNGNAISGGGVTTSFDSEFTLTNSRVTGNTATSSGGGIFARGVLTLSGSRVDDNSASGGGGILITGGPVTITASEISDNSVSGSGGGISSSGTLALVNSTVSGNRANRDGGGVYIVESIDNRLFNTTISANTADADGDDTGNGGGVRSGGIISLANTLIGGNSDNSSGGTQHPDCSGAVSTQGYNLITNITGCNLSGDTTGNLTGVDPLLGPLQNNGGSTRTHALLGGSPAIDAANPNGCRDQDDDLLNTDQRGFDRPGSGSTLCDIGAYEAGEGAPPTTATTPAPATQTPTATATATSTTTATPTTTATLSPTPAVTATPTETGEAPALQELYLPILQK